MLENDDTRDFFEYLDLLTRHWDNDERSEREYTAWSKRYCQAMRRRTVKEARELDASRPLLRANSLLTMQKRSLDCLRTLPCCDRDVSQTVVPETRQCIEPLGTARSLPLTKSKIEAEKMSEGDRRGSLQQQVKIIPKRRADTIDDPDAHRKSKRKRSDANNLVAKGRQIFRGLKFLFLPNTETSLTRKIRIRKVQEHGAIRAEKWGESGITHLIVDVSISYSEVIRFLNIEHIPTGIVLVNVDYISECLRFHAVVRYDFSYLRPEGTPRSSDGTAASDGPAQILRSGISEHVDKVISSRAKIPAASLESAPVSQADNCSSTDPSMTNLTAHGQSELARTDDCLTQIIEEIKRYKNLPLSDENDSSDMDPSERIINPDDEVEPRPKRRKVANQMTAEQGQNIFACMHENAESTTRDNPNQPTIEVLQQMVQYYETQKDQWRVFSYRRAISVLRKQTELIATVEAARALPQIGERLADKIEEIVTSGCLRRLDNALSDPRDQLLIEFTSCYGVGTLLASSWIAQGFKSLAEVREQATLSEIQKIGIDHREDFLARISRDEVTRHGAFVKRVAKELDAEVKVEIMGSYRRGASTSGDIDIIITKAGASVSQLSTCLNKDLVPLLFAEGFLKAGLTTGKRATSRKWHGASCLPGLTIWRRIDLLLVPEDELGAACIYFTGNDVFNRSIRLLARRKGMRLNQHGLWKDVFRDKAQRQTTQGTLLEGRSETRIFEILGVPWRPARHRNC